MASPPEFIGRWMDRNLPVSDDCANIHHGITGVMVLAAGVCGEEIIATIERHGVDADPIAFMATVAVTAATAIGAGFFWRRGWQSRGE